MSRSLKSSLDQLDVNNLDLDGWVSQWEKRHTVISDLTEYQVRGSRRGDRGGGEGIRVGGVEEER